MPDELQLVSQRPLTSPTLRDVAAVFFRQKKLFLYSFALFLAAGILYSAFFPSYEAEIKVLVRRGRIDPLITPTPSASQAFAHDEITEEEVNSEMELLRNQDILREVVHEAGLSRPTWFSKLTRQSAEQREEKAVRRLARQLEVQPVRKSRLITVSYSSSDPERSAAVLRSLAHAYLAKQAELHRPGGERTFFERQVAESRQSLEQAQVNLIAFTQREGIVSAELQRDLALQKLSDAQASELALESATAETSERNRILEIKLRELPERRVGEIKSADNPELQEKLKSKLLELELRRTELLTKFQPSYRLVQEVDTQISEAKATIEAERLKPLRDETTEDNPEYQWAHSEHLKSQVELAALMQKEAVARAQISEYRDRAQSLGVQAVAQRDLQQTLKSAEEKWLLYSNKREEARIGDALDENKVVNVALAEAPHQPALPVWSFWTASCVAFLGAFGLSAGLIFVTDYLDPSFRTADEVMRALGTPVLASLPAASTRERGRRSEQA